MELCLVPHRQEQLIHFDFDKELLLDKKVDWLLWIDTETQSQLGI